MQPPVENFLAFRTEFFWIFGMQGRKTETSKPPSDEAIIYSYREIIEFILYRVNFPEKLVFRYFLQETKSVTLLPARDKDPVLTKFRIQGSVPLTTGDI